MVNFRGHPRSYKKYELLNICKKSFFSSKAVKLVIRYFAAAEFIKNNGFAPSSLYAEL